MDWISKVMGSCKKKYSKTITNKNCSHGKNTAKRSKPSSISLKSGATKQVLQCLQNKCNVEVDDINYIVQGRSSVLLSELPEWYSVGEYFDFGSGSSFIAGTPQLSCVDELTVLGKPSKLINYSKTADEGGIVQLPMVFENEQSLTKEPATNYHNQFKKPAITAEKISDYGSDTHLPHSKKINSYFDCESLETLKIVDTFSLAASASADEEILVKYGYVLLRVV